MQPRAILESALYVDDLDAAEEFYGQVIGLPLIRRLAGRHAFFRCGEGILLLFRAEATEVPLPAGAPLPVPTHGARGPGHLCFRAGEEGLDGWRKHLEAQGVTIEADFEWPGGGRSIYFRDPAGNSLEFAEPRIWGIE